MSKRFLSIVGIIALLVWTLGGVVAWALTKEGVTITIQEGNLPGNQGGDKLALLEDRLGSLQEDLGNLAKTLGSNFQVLQENLSEDLGGQSQKLQTDFEARLGKLNKEFALLREERRKELLGLEERIEGLRKALLQKAKGAPPSRSPQSSLVAQRPKKKKQPKTLNPALKTKSAAKKESPAHQIQLGQINGHHNQGHQNQGHQSQEHPSPAHKKKHTFLSFTLPSQSVSFQKRQRWTLLPSLSRVGFDGTSTLHNFSGVTSKLKGSLEVDLSHPDLKPMASIQVWASALKTGVKGRDAEMYKTLDISKYPQIRFRLTSFEKKRVDAKAEKVMGIAHGDMSIRGVSQAVVMPTTLFLDSSRRLHIEGEMPLDLTDYKITPPSMMGVVGMGKKVKVWIRLRARVVQGKRRGGKR